MSVSLRAVQGDGLVRIQINPSPLQWVNQVLILKPSCIARA